MNVKKEQYTPTAADWADAMSDTGAFAAFAKAFALSLAMIAAATLVDFPPALRPLLVVAAVALVGGQIVLNIHRIALEAQEGEAWQAAAAADEDRQKAIAIVKQAIAKANASSASANAARKEAVAAINEADAMRSQLESNATAMEKLSDEMRALQARLKNRSERIAAAEKAKADAANRIAVLSQELTIAENRIRRYEKAEAERKAHEEAAMFAKSVKATWSACGKDEAKMEEKFSGKNWRELVGA